MTFAFAIARKLYEQGQHPRILLGPDEIERLRRQSLRPGPAQQIVAHLEQSLTPLARQIVDCPDLPKLLDFYGGGAWASIGYRTAVAMTPMALLSHLRPNELWVDAVRRVLFCAAPGGMGGMSIAGAGSMAFDMAYPHLSPGERARVVALFTKQAKAHLAGARSEGYLRRAANNIPLSRQMLPAAYTMLALWNEPGAGSLQKEQACLLQMIEASLHTSIHPSGYPEEDIGYGSSVAVTLLILSEAISRAGWYDAHQRCPRLGNFGRAMLHFILPWGRHLSMTGDHPPVFPLREFALTRLAAQTGDRTLNWLLGALEDDGMPPSRDAVLPPPRGRKAGKNPPNVPKVLKAEERLQIHGVTIPASMWSLLQLEEMQKPLAPPQAKVPTAFCDEHRGLASFRSGWGENDALAVFDGSQRSPSGQGHFHASCGHFSFSALGEYFGIDTGRYCIEQNQHNVVLVDGKSGRSTNGQWLQTTWPGRMTACRPGPLADYAAVDSSHQHNCYWAMRHLWLVKSPAVGGYLWIVDDLNKADDFATFWWTMHTSPENRITLGKDRATIRGWRRGNSLDVHFALPDPKCFPKPHRLQMAQDEVTTSSYEYVEKPRQRVRDYGRPADMTQGILFLRPRLIAKVSGYNGRFMSLLTPWSSSAQRAQVKQLPSPDNTLAMQVRWPDYQDTLIWAFENHLLQAGEVAGRGDWCIVRQHCGSGKVLAWDSSAGASLQVGKRVLSEPTASVVGQRDLIRSNT